MRGVNSNSLVVKAALSKSPRDKKKIWINHHQFSCLVMGDSSLHAL